MLPAIFKRLTQMRQRTEFALFLTSFLAFYFVSFYMLQTYGNFAILCDGRSDQGLSFAHLQIRYFSEDPTTNRALYYLYWPVHNFFIAHADPESMPVTNCDEFPKEPLYIRDIENIFP